MPQKLDVRTADVPITVPSGEDGSGKFLEEFYVIMWIETQHGRIPTANYYSPRPTALIKPRALAAVAPRYDDICLPLVRLQPYRAISPTNCSPLWQP